MAEILAMFEAEMAEEQNEDLQKRIFASNMTPAEYLAMVTTCFDAQQYKNIILDDAKIKLLDSHLSHISKIYPYMAKNRSNEKVIAQKSKVELENCIKEIKKELYHLRMITENQLPELKILIDIEIELKNQKIVRAEQRAIVDGLKQELYKYKSKEKNDPAIR